MRRRPRLSNPAEPFSIIYLSGVRTEVTDAIVTDNDEVPLGLLAQPLTEDYLSAQHVYRWLGLDNGAFTDAGQRRFRLDHYLAMAETAVQRWGDGLLFVTAPDVAFKWRETLERSLPVLPMIRNLGAPDTLVLQDGATIENVPWSELDVIFIGGSTAWKIGPMARALTREARKRRKWVHMGRVNSAERMLTAQHFGVDSADGTYLLHATDLAVATYAVLRLMRMAGRGDERQYAALEALRSSSPVTRKTSVTRLLRSDCRFAAALAAAVGDDKPHTYRKIALEATDKLASITGTSGQAARIDAERAGDIIAVGDIMDWLRGAARTVPAEKRARNLGEFHELRERSLRASASARASHKRAT